MVKGISRQVIVVHAPEQKLFEQAIFILKDDALRDEGITEDLLLKEAQKLIRRLADKEISLTLSPEVISMLVDKGYDPQYGARPMRRAIERLLEDPIAEAILRGELVAGCMSRAIRPEGTNDIAFREDAPEPSAETPRKRTPRKRKEKKDE